MSEAIILKVQCQGKKDACVKWSGCCIAKSLCWLAFSSTVQRRWRKFVCISKTTHLFTAVFKVITVLGPSCKLAAPVFWYYLEHAVQLICFRGQILSTGKLCLICSSSSPPPGIKIDYKNPGTGLW